MSQCHGALHPWSGRGSRRLRNVEPTHNHPKQDYRTGFAFCFSHFAVRDVLQYQRRPRRSPRRPLPESSAVSAVQLPSPEPEASPPDLPAELILQVPASPPSAVVRRLGQGRPPAPPGRPPSCFSECAPPGSSAVPARVARQARFTSVWSLSSAVPVWVVRRPRQGRPPSYFCECQSAVPARVVRRPRQIRALFASAKAPSPPGSSAVPARVARQAHFPSVWSLSSVRVVESGSPAKLIFRVSGVCRLSGSSSAKAPSPPGSSAVPTRASRQARFTIPSPPGSPAVLASRPPSSFYECLESVVRRQGQKKDVAPFRQGGPPSPSGSSAVPARVARQECQSAVPARPPRFTSVWSVSSAVPARVVCARPPSSFCECQSAVPARVVRRPRQGRF